LIKVGPVGVRIRRRRTGRVNSRGVDIKDRGEIILPAIKFFIGVVTERAVGLPESIRFASFTLSGSNTVSNAIKLFGVVTLIG